MHTRIYPLNMYVKNDLITLGVAVMGLKML